MGTDELASRIDAAIRDSTATKADVARAVGRSWPTVHAWCTGKHTPSPEDLGVISEMTGVPLSALVGGAAELAEPTTAAWLEFKATPDYRMAKPWMIQALIGMRPEAGEEPVLETYRRITRAMLSIPGDRALEQQLAGSRPDTSDQDS